VSARRRVSRDRRKSRSSSSDNEFAAKQRPPRYRAINLPFFHGNAKVRSFSAFHPPRFRFSACPFRNLCVYSTSLFLSLSLSLSLALSSSIIFLFPEEAIAVRIAADRLVPRLRKTLTRERSSFLVSRSMTRIRGFRINVIGGEIIDKYED